MSDSDQREEAVFEAALQLQGAERVAYLDQACASNPTMRERVAGLLGALERAGGLLNEPAVPRDQVPPAAPSPTAQPGDRIGRYKLLQQIGEGGCGVVYMAEQEEPVRRRVALKILKLGLDTKQVIGRFEAERQALALMDHPNIARVFDAGATETGRPYFVMELVRGVKITEFCDEQKLSTSERLRLFIQVCQAVQHAHQKGIIHRDLKPSNILVTVNDGVPVPKVIDFGIAKATTGQPLTDLTVFTAFEQFIGTPAYMSPEQAVMTSVDIDTRSDIYSLGVLLYELLTGQTPFDTKELLAAGFDEMRRTIREQEPARPSTRLSTMVAGELTTTAQRRHTDAPKLIHLVRGDLDWIVMKALEKDRARRYETANGLAADLARHLNDEPVVARPPSRLYEFQKTVRRHKFGFATAAALMLVLALGVLMSTREAIRATRAEQEQTRLLAQAETARDAATKQEQLARESGARAEQQQRLASEQELLARRRFYAAQIGLAYQAWEAGDVARAQELLETQRPQPGQKDLRTFEWYHLWGLCHARHLATLRGHHKYVLGLAFAPDGKTLASSSEDGTIRLWDVPSSQERAALKPQSWINGIAFTPDGKTLASGSEDHSVRLWDVAGGRLRAQLTGHASWVQALTVSPDGKILAGGADGGVVRLWDMPDGRDRATLTGHNGWLLSLAFSPDSSTLAVASDWGPDTGYVRLWDVTRDPPELKQRIGVGTRTVAWSPDGKTLATSNFEKIQLWDTTTGEPRGFLIGHFSQVRSAAWLDEGTLVSCSEDRTVRLWSLQTNEFGRTTSQILGAHLDAATCLAISRDGTTLASGGHDGSLELWNLNTTREQAEARFTSVFRFGGNSNSLNNLNSLLLSPDGSTLYLVTDEGTRFRNVVAGFDEAELPQAKGRGALSPDGRLLATGDTEGMLKLWEVASGRLLASVQAHPKGASSLGVWALAFSKDGRTLATGGYEDDRGARLWEVDAGLKYSRTIGVGARGVNALDFFPDGKTLAIAARPWTIQLVDLSTGLPQGHLRWGSGSLETWAEALSPDGKLAAAGGSSGAVMLWEAATGRLHATLKGHSSTVLAIAFSPDGGTVATGSDDFTVRLWDVITGQERVTFKGHHTPIVALVFATDGNSLWSGGRDGTVRLLRAEHVPEAVAEATPATAEDDTPRAWERAIQETTHRSAVPPGAGADSHLEGPNPDFWVSRARLAFEAGRTDDALASYAQAIEVIGTNTTAFGNALSHALLGRATVLKGQGRLAEAQTDVQRAERFSPLETQVWLHSIDLSEHFNEPLPDPHYAGLRDAGGVVYEVDVRGVVHLLGTHDRPGGPPYPAKVEGIRLRRTARRLHFIHAVSYETDPLTTKLGTTIGSYRMHFTDGRMQELPIVYGQDVLMWEGAEESEPKDSGLKVVWRENDKRLFKSVWENPWPEVELSSLDFVSTVTDAAPFLVAITAE